MWFISAVGGTLVLDAIKRSKQNENHVEYVYQGTAYGGYKPTCNWSYKPIAPLAQIVNRNILGLVRNPNVTEKKNKGILTIILNTADLG